MRLAPLSRLRRRRVVVLPDTYVDVVAPLPAWETALPQMRRIVGRGGGNLPIGPVEVKVGGNAANLGVALARLGARVDLIAETDALGRHLLEERVGVSGLGLRRVRESRHAAATLALEFRGSNLMLSHAGPVREFGPSKLDAEDWGILESADAVAVVNWSQNLHGTALLRAVATRLHPRGIFVYVDTGDPRHRGEDAQALARERGLWEHVDAWGLNENEALAFTGRRRGRIDSIVRAWSEDFPTRLDLHTRTWAATIQKGQMVRVPAYRSRVRRLTGAGDAWNAGNLAGYLLDWPPRQRLRFAHQVATKYVTNPDGLPPSASDVKAPT